MCKLAFVAFDEGVTQERRGWVVQMLARNSWEMGNKDGIGVVTWGGEVSEPLVQKALKIEEWVLPASIGDFALVHARASTNSISLANTHPFVGGGAYLVHNGVVQPRDSGTRLVPLQRTNNDTELILKAYLTAGRSFVEATKSFSGWANVGIWDAERGVLTLYPDTGRWAVMRQDGVTLIVQDDKQGDSIIQTGLDHPVALEELETRKVYEIELPLTRSWGETLARATETAETVTVPASSYSYQYHAGEYASHPYSIQLGSERVSHPPPLVQTQLPVRRVAPIERPPTVKEMRAEAREKRRRLGNRIDQRLTRFDTVLQRWVTEPSDEGFDGWGD